MPAIFLSYSSKDRRFALELKDRLEARGVEVWMDEAELRVGDSLVERVSDAISRVDYVAVVISGASVESRWVREELQQAISRQIDEGRVLVLPLLIERCELPPMMVGRKYADFTTPARYDASFEQVLRTIIGAPDRELPVFRNQSGNRRGVRLLAAGALLMVLSAGLSQAWKAPPQLLWETRPHITTTKPGNTQFTREIRSLGRAPIGDTLVWRFAVTADRRCLGVQIVEEIARPDVMWREVPEIWTDAEEPRKRDFIFEGLPHNIKWTLGVTVKGVVPRDCLHLELEDPGKVEVSRLPLPIARLLTNQAVLGAIIFIAMVLLGCIAAPLSTVFRGKKR